MEKQSYVHGERERSYQWRNEDFDFSRNSNCKEEKQKKKRFSEEQIKWLKEIFEKEKKLDPRRKMEVARQLRLEPKQVAIWFQNKRASSKSKQLQTDFATLRVHYDCLARDFQKSLEEKHHLLSQVQKLRAQTSEKQRVKSLDQDSEVDREIDNRDHGNRAGIEPDGKVGSSGESTKTAEFGSTGSEDLLFKSEVYSWALSDKWAELLECLGF
ncbi:PREDICTED: homeobox-leucine zipper protein ATHB-12-like [Tarenaya hassleriana]|uniref:homeobox-leucine zipper protein ATHB-12-like n=1 Tax=Tarenaya hassleriana TaxID=28532 RepID=UPI00053C99C6|nr:PREDICTED: homeobox-leucine zipper protein ATHB-12-like [Tarenaya hassleriana]